MYQYIDKVTRRTIGAGFPVTVHTVPFLSTPSLATEAI